METEILEVIKWYEKHIGRKLTEAERMSIRQQCILYNQNKPETKDLERFGIRLSGLEYGDSEKVNETETTCLDYLEECRISGMEEDIMKKYYLEQGVSEEMIEKAEELLNKLEVR